MFLAMKKLWDRAFSGPSADVLRGMATLAMGTGLARAIGLVSIPILTRLYAPEDFGAVSVFTAIISILAPILSFRYVLALPLPRRDGMAMNLFVLSLGLMLLSGTVLSLLLWAFSEELFSVFSMEVLAPWWWLIIIGVLASGVYEALNMWATRQREYKIIARTKVWQSAAGSLTKLIFGFMAVAPAGLLFGQVVSSGGGIGSLFHRYGRDFRTNLQYVRVSRMRRAASRYRAFPIYRMPSQFIMIFSSQAPLLGIAALYDAQTTGQAGLALMALGLSIQLFGRTLANAFYAEAANIGAKQADRIRTLTYSILKRLSVFAVPPTLILLFFGEALFAVFFGSEWRMAGTLSSILAIYLFCQFLQTPVGHIFYLFDGQKKLLMLNIQRLVLVAVVFYISWRIGADVYTAVLMYSVTMAVHYAASVVYALRSIPKES